MLKKILITGVIAGTFFSAGCGYTMVAVGHNYHQSTPAYCYDCHSRPVWSIGISRCNQYSIRIAHDGYYYRPYRQFRHGRHENFRFRRFDFSHDKPVRGRR